MWSPIYFLMAVVGIVVAAVGATIADGAPSIRGPRTGVAMLVVGLGLEIWGIWLMSNQ